MAIRQTRFQIKNSQNSAAPFSGVTLLTGEPIVNTASGIMMFAGVTTGTNDWTPAGPGGNGNFFEVGSNLYDLRLRNQITQYQGQSGVNLVGKFLSGTTNGFVLADIVDIANTADSYTTGATWSPNTLTINLNNGRPSVPVTINTFNGITIYGSNTINGDLTVTGTTILNGPSYYNNIASVSNEIVNYSTLTSYTQNTDVYVTGNTYTNSTNSSNSTTYNLTYHGIPLNGPYTLTGSDSFTTGGTWNSGTSSIDFKRNDGVTYSVDLSGIDVNDTFVTGFTYNPTNNTFTILQNEGELPLTASINSVSGLTITNLTPGRVVYVGTGSVLTDESGFEYNDGANLLTVGNINVQNPSGTTANIGQGGLVIGSGGSISAPGIGDLTVHGNLMVFGTATTISTNELYVEDPQITLNYNPTGNTSSTSVSSGIKVQSGNGTLTGDTYFTIGQMQNLTGIVVGQNPDVSEYTGLLGYSNRGWVTQLNDIVIRNNNLNEGSPNGVRVLAEFDTLDGGTY